MFRWLIEDRLHALEQRLGASVDYVRQLSALSPMAFLKFSLLLPAAAHRRAASREMVHAARLVAAQSEDCGSCVRMAVNVARQDGVADDLLQAILDGSLYRAPPDVELACRFAQSVAHRTGEVERLRNKLHSAYGDVVVMELSLAIATARVFPTLKRGMGFATNCSEPCVNHGDKFDDAGSGLPR